MLTTKEIRDLLKKVELGTITNDEVLKLRSVSREEYETLKENDQAREFYSQKGIKNLYNAICEEAVMDYKKLRKKKAFKRYEDKDLEKQIKELETFFGEDFFKNVSGCEDKEKTINAINTQLKMEAMKNMV